MNRPCETAPASVEDLLDGRLSPEEAAALHTHLELCATCREVLADETRLRALLTPPAPEGFLEDIMAGVRVLPRHRRRGRLRLLLLPPLIAAAAAILILAVLGGPDVDPDVDSRDEPVLVEKHGDTWGRRTEEDDGTTERSVRARDLARRARLLLDAARSAPELLRHDLAVSGFAVAAEGVDPGTLAPADRGAVQRLLLLDEAWRNGAPVARAEIAWATGGTR